MVSGVELKDTFEMNLCDPKVGPPLAGLLEPSNVAMGYGMRFDSHVVVSIVAGPPFRSYPWQSYQFDHRPDEA